MRSKILAALALCSVLIGCGSDTSATPTPPTPTPVPVTYGGLYKGTMTDNFASTLTRYDAEISITHSGNVVNSEYLLLSNAFGQVIRYPVGSATLTAGEFRSSSSYNSSGCGSVTYNVVGRYSGDAGILNLTYTGDTVSCGHFDMRGELRR